MNITLSMPYHASHTHNESGNVLIYILIGIVLLAALNFAFSQGADTGSDSTVDKGEAVIAASDIIRYAGSVQQATRQLISNEGCSENELSFSFKSGGNYQHTPLKAPKKCRVFHFDGGGMSYDKPKDKWVTSPQDWYFPKDACVKDVGTSSTNCASGNEEIMIMLPNIDQQICQQINSKLNIDGIPSIDWVNGFGGGFYDGTLSATSGRQIDGVLTGQRSGCFADDNGSPGGQHYYHVIIAR